MFFVLVYCFIWCLVGRGTFWLSVYTQIDRQFIYNLVNCSNKEVCQRNVHKFNLNH